MGNSHCKTVKRATNGHVDEALHGRGYQGPQRKSTIILTVFFKDWMLIASQEMPKELLRCQPHALGSDLEVV